MVKVQQKKRKADTDHLLNTLDIDDLAYESGFYKRSPQKVTAISFVKGFWQMQQKGKNTLRNWAVQTGLIIGESVSKQGIESRLNPSAVALSKKLLEKALEVSCDSLWLEKQKQDLGPVLSLFNRILIQDSTVQKVPSIFFKQLGGNSDGTTALMRIQAIYDFKEETWQNFSVDSYSKNDQSQAKWGLDKLEKRDLVIRDLGYFTLDALEKLSEDQYFITSYKSNTYLYDQQGNKIELLKLLRERGSIDQLVLVGKKKKLKMRLVAKKLSGRQHKRRIREAKNKKKNQGRKTYSKQYLELLGYEIFLTNIEEDLLDGSLISKLYGLRWYIEILFKAWKSYFNFKSFFEKKQMSYNRFLVSIYLILLNFIYIQNYLYQYIEEQVRKKSKKHLSILKFLDVVNDLFHIIINIKSLKDLDKLISLFIENAVYEKRNKRKNMKEKYQYFKGLKIRKAA